MKVSSQRIIQSATIEVPDHESLRAAWRLHGGPLTLVGRFIVRKSLTASQRTRLPKALKDLL
jgi:hypothetical protein